MTVVAIDPSWIKTEDDVVIVKLKYNKDYYDEWARLVVVKNDGDYNDFYVEFDKRDFNIHFVPERSWRSGAARPSRN